MYLDLEILKEEFKIAPKEVIDTCLAILLQSENKDTTLTVSEQLAIETLEHYKILKK